MGHARFQDNARSGLSLLELILAMTMLAIVILAGSHLDLAAVRMSNTIFGDVAVQNDLLYLLQLIEKDLTNANVIEIQPTPPNPANTLRLNIDGQNIFYTFESDLSNVVTIKRKIGAIPGAADPALTTNTPGVTLMARMTTAVIPQPMPVIDEIAVDERIIRLNLAAQRTMENQKLAAHSGLSKSIILRGEVKVTAAPPPVTGG